MSLQTIVFYVVLGLVGLFLFLSFLFYAMTQPDFWNYLFKALVFAGCIVLFATIYQTAKNDPSKITNILNVNVYKLIWIVIGIFTASLLLMQIILFLLGHYISVVSLLVYYVYIFFIVLLYLPVYFIIVRDKTIEMLKFGVIPVVLLGFGVFITRYVSFSDRWKSTMVFYFAYVLYIYLMILGLETAKHANKIADSFNAIITI